LEDRLTLSVFGENRPRPAYAVRGDVAVMQLLTPSNPGSK
jgi:hypothetical protein